MTNLRNEIDQYEQKLKDAEELLEVKTNDNDKLRQNLENKRNSIKDLKEQLQSKEIELSASITDNSIKDHEIERLNDELTTYMSELQGCEEEISDMYDKFEKESLEKANSEKKSKQKEISKLNAKLAEYSNKLSDAKLELEGAKMDAKILGMKVSDLESMLNRETKPLEVTMDKAIQDETPASDIPDKNFFDSFMV